MSSQAINIPTTSLMHAEGNLDSDFAAHSLTSPVSMSSPFSNVSASTAASNAHLMASSFATSISAASPPTSDDMTMGSSQMAGLDGSPKKHKPHKCDVCGACFARKVHLQRHSLRHQVCKPYCCERCGKCFSRQDSLVRHHRLLHESGRDKPTKASLMAGMTSKKAKKTAARVTPEERACIRCSSIAVKCDGLQPCSRCTANHGGQSCCYAPSSSLRTIGAATAKSDKRSRQRHDSIATTSSSAVTEDDESLTTVSDSNSWSAHGVRRDTASSVASTVSEFMSPVSAGFGPGMESTWGQMAGQQMQPMVHQPHPFELPQLDAHFADVKSLQPDQVQNGLLDTAVSMPELLSLLPELQQQQQQQQHFPQENNHSVPLMPMFDWSSLMHEHHQDNGGQGQPFTGAASNRGLNATLLSDEHQMAHDSSFPSPAIQGSNQTTMMQEGDHAHSFVATPFGRQANSAMHHPVLPPYALATDQASLTQVGLHLPSTMNINVPGNLTMSADNWEGFMRSLSAYGNRPTGEGVSA